jgi:hypothetical protein
MYSKNPLFPSGIFWEKSVSFLKHENPTHLIIFFKNTKIDKSLKNYGNKKNIFKKLRDHKFFFSHKKLFSKSIFDFSFLDIFKRFV